MSNTFGGAGITAEDVADAVWNKTLGSDTAETVVTDTLTEASLGRKMVTNKAVISLDGNTVTVYDDDETTVLHIFNISDDRNTRTPA